MMPRRSDNLYSADTQEESDAQSLSDELSPSDGYFQPAQTVVPGERMVQDPSLSLDTKEAEPKTLMPINNNEHSRNGNGSQNSVHPLLPQPRNSVSAASRREPSEGSNDGTSSASYTPQSSMHYPRRDLLPRRPASINEPPPAYSPPQSPIAPPSASTPSYNTSPEHHLEAGLPLLQRTVPTYQTFSQPSPPSPREPESMGNPAAAGISENTPLTLDPYPPSRYHRFVHRRKSACSRILKHLFVIVLVLIVLSSTLGWILDMDSDNNLDGEPSTGTPPSRSPPSPPSSSPEDVFKPSGTYCSQANIRRDPVSYDFKLGDDLKIVQSTVGSMDNCDGCGVRVETNGEIRLRRLPKGSYRSEENRGRVSVDVYVSDPAISVQGSWEGNLRTLVIKTPRWAKVSTPGPHCVSVEITAWVPEDAELTNLDFEAVTLGLRLFEDVNASVTGNTNFWTTTGKVWFPEVESSSSDQISTFSSRWIKVETVSGAISGQYPLLDYLGLSSASGHIEANIVPKPALKTSPAPATLDAHTASSHIHIKLPNESGSFTPPARDYVTKVHSESGSITGFYYLGSSSSITTTSSHISITGLPIQQADAEERSNKFETYSISGTTDVTVLSPLFLTLLNQKSPYTPIHDNDPYLLLPPCTSALFAVIPYQPVSKTPKLRSLKSAHASESANIRVSYPSEWEGRIEGNTLSGKIEVSGEGLRVISSKDRYGMKSVVAIKGVEKEEDGGLVEMTAISGRLEFLVGE